MLSDDEWHLRFETALDDRDNWRKVAETFATALHVPREDSDGVTVHGWAPEHPMGCPVCEALDRAFGFTA